MSTCDRLDLQTLGSQLIMFIDSQPRSHRQSMQYLNFNQASAQF